MNCTHNSEHNNAFVHELVKEWRARHHAHSSLNGTTGNRNYFLYTNVQKQRHFHIHIYQTMVGGKLRWMAHVTRAKFDRRPSQRTWKHFRTKRIPICEITKFGITGAIQFLKMHLAAGIRKSEQQISKYGSWDKRKLPNETFGNYASPPRTPTKEEQENANKKMREQNSFNQSLLKLKQLKKAHKYRSEKGSMTENEFLKSNSKRLMNKTSIVKKYGLSNQTSLQNAIKQLQALGEMKGYIRKIANTSKPNSKTKITKNKSKDNSKRKTKTNPVDSKAKSKLK